jgi:hypothetical protein
MREPATIGVRLGKPEPEDDRVRRLSRIDRLPWIGERTGPGLAFETFGDIGGGHGWISCSNELASPLNAIAVPDASPTKFQTGFRHLFETAGRYRALSI